MITQRLNEDVVKTQELSLAAALIAWNFPLTSLDRSDVKRAIFIFSKTPELEKAIKDFWDDSRTTSPIRYFQALRELKSRIYGR